MRYICLDYIIVVSIIFLIFPSTIYAQIDTTLKDFFPMHIGDYWEYMDEDFPEPTLHYYLRIKKDTIMPNAIKYFQFDEVDFKFPSDSDRYYHYYRMDDSLIVYKYVGNVDSCGGGEYPLYKLAACDRSVWNVCIDLLQNDSHYIGLFSTYNMYFMPLNIDTLSKYFLSASKVDSTDTLWTTMGVNDWLAKGLGVAKTKGEGASTVNLVGAIIGGERYGTTTNIIEPFNSDVYPTIYNLYQNYPNPFNSYTSIRYTIPRSTFVNLNIYNVAGQLVYRVINSHQDPGNYKIDINPSDLPSGIYYYQLRAVGFQKIKMMVLIK